MPQVCFENVTLGYNGNAVVNDVSFAVNKGDYLCIIGENGAGKSTLIKTFLNLLKPLTGTVVFGDGLKRNELSYLPQQREVQKDFPASVYEIVLSGFINRSGLRPFYNRREKAAASANMQKLGISDLAKKCYRELSGGQQQRVLLARALCAASGIIVLDEPAAGLDPTATKDMYEQIEKLNHDDGVTVVMVSHDIEAALRYATHILKIGKESCFFGTKEDYIAKTQGGNS